MLQLEVLMGGRWVVGVFSLLPALVAAADLRAPGPVSAANLEGVAGVVADAITQTPLAGVVVMANGVDLDARVATTTDARGLFHLPALRPGHYLLWSRPAGYLCKLASVQVQAGGAALVALDAFQLRGPRDVPQVATAAAAQHPGPLRFEARTLRSTYLSGEPIQVLGLLRNVGPTPVVVIKQVEGSTWNLRNPTYGVRAVTLPEGSPAAVAMHGGLICGVTNPLFKGDVIEVLPGKAVDPFEPLDGHHFRQGHLRADATFSFERPGRYAIWLEYTNVAARIENVADCAYRRDRLSQAETARLDRLHLPVPARAPLVVDRLQSNRVELEIVDRPEAAGFALVPPPLTAPFEPARVLVEVRDGFGRLTAKASVSGLGLGLFANSGGGRFTHANVLPGRYELWARDSRGREVGRETVEVAPGAEVSVRIQRDAFGSVRVAVTNLPDEGTLPSVALFPGQLPMPASFDVLRSQKILFQPRPGPRSEPMVFPKLPVGKYTLFIGLPVLAGRTEVYRQEVEVRLNQDQLLEIVLPDDLPPVPSRAGSPQRK